MFEGLLKRRKFSLGLSPPNHCEKMLQTAQNTHLIIDRGGLPLLEENYG